VLEGLWLNTFSEKSIFNFFASTYIWSIDVSIFNDGSVTFNSNLFANWNLVIVSSFVIAVNALHVYFRILLKSLVTGYLNVSSSICTMI
jgi:hypothetical protein